MNKILKITLAALGAVTFLSGTAYLIETLSAKHYNQTFREEYIAQTYPNAEIIEINNESSSWFGGATSANCHCYDTKEDIYFTQEFVLGRNGKYTPCDEGSNSYQTALSAKKDVQRCMDKAAEILSNNCEYKIVRDPLNPYDFLVFIKDPEIWQADELYSALHDTTNDIFRSDGGEYINYQIIICGESAYEKLTGLELFSGKPNRSSGYSANAFKGFDIAYNTDIETEKFDYNKGGDNQQLFKVYQQAYGGTYSDIILWISGEPNKYPRDVTYDYFGLKY